MVYSDGDNLLIKASSRDGMKGLFEATYNPETGELSGGMFNYNSMGDLLTGMLDYPMYSILQGTINISSTSVLSLITQQVADPLTQLSIKFVGPKALSPGETASFKIILLNRSTSTVTERSLQVALPQEYVFLSATGDYTYSKIFHALRFRLPDIVPGETVSYDMTIKTKPGLDNVNVEITYFTVNSESLDAIHSEMEQQMWSEED